MNKLIDLTSQKFGRLTVIKRASKNGVSSNVYWECKCDCGTENVIVRGTELRNGSTKSCGCLQKELLVERTKKYNQWEVISDDVIKGTTNNQNRIEFFISKQDFEKVKGFCWYADYDEHVDDYYICARINGKNIALHRFVLDVTDSEVLVDHINHNTRNNTRENLRIGSSSNNAMNKKIISSNTSGTTGVRWHKATQKWQADICVNQKNIYLGVYENFDNAVRVRRRAEEKYFNKWSYKESMEDKLNGI